MLPLPHNWRPEARKAPRLFEVFPSLHGALPFLPLAHTPTRVTRLDALASYLGRDDIWMKRDDEISPLYGGNKIRRYEFVLAEALARGSGRVITAGGIASTQAMATSLFCEALGLEVTAVIFDQDVTRFAQHALRVNASAGTRLIRGGGYVTSAFRLIRELARMQDAYFILPGASHALANIGYVDAMLELADQVEAGVCRKPDVIVVPTGSAGTLAALCLGAAYLGWETEVVGARVATRFVTNGWTVRSRIRATHAFLSQRIRGFRLKSAPRWSLDHGVFGTGYGAPTPEAVANIARVRQVIGVDGEVTYSGKALASLRRVASEPRFAGKNILLWQTLSSAPARITPDADDRIPPSFRSVLSRHPVDVVSADL